MKIEILKDGKRDAKTGKPLKKGEVVEMSEERAKKALSNGNGKKVEDSKKSNQEKVSEKTTKK